MPITREKAICPLCKKPFEQLVITVLGVEAARAKVCQDCLPKDELGYVLGPDTITSWPKVEPEEERE